MREAEESGLNNQHVRCHRSSELKKFLFSTRVIIFILILFIRLYYSRKQSMILKKKNHQSIEFFSRN